MTANPTLVSRQKTLAIRGASIDDNALSRHIIYSNESFYRCSKKCGPAESKWSSQFQLSCGDKLIVYVPSEFK
jgi:hypothetical protein